MNAAKLPSRPAADLHSALKRMIKTRRTCYRKKLRECQEHFSERAVHQTRIEARRLLSMVELLGPFTAGARIEKICCTLKKHLNTFDDLRDTQVELTLVKRWSKQVAVARSFQKYLCKRERRCMGRARRDVKRLKTARLLRQIKCLCNDWDEHGGKQDGERDFAQLLAGVHRAFRKVMELKRRARAEDASSIHRTRIAFKHFRYMVEVLVPLLPPVEEGLLPGLHAYQTRMGCIQDLEVLLEDFNRFVEKKRIPADRLEAFRKKIEQRSQKLIRAYFAHADELKSFWPPGELSRPGQKHA